MEANTLSEIRITEDSDGHAMDCGGVLVRRGFGRTRCLGTEDGVAVRVISSCKTPQDV